MTEISSSFKVAGSAAWDTGAEVGSGNGGLSLMFGDDLQLGAHVPRVMEVGKRRTMHGSEEQRCERCNCRLNHLNSGPRCAPCDIARRQAS